MTSFFVRQAATWQDTPDQQLTFQHSTSTNMNGDTTHYVQALINGEDKIDGKPAGYMRLNGDTPTDGFTSKAVPGEILGLNVHPDLRGMGVGRAMGEYAQSQGMQVVHSPQRTRAGDQFAKATPEFGVVKRKKLLPSMGAFFVRQASGPFDPNTHFIADGGPPRVLNDQQVSNRQDTGNGYQTILMHNFTQRHNVGHDQVDHEFFDSLDHTIRQSQLPEAMTLHRGLRVIPTSGLRPQMDAHVPGDAVKFNGFTSTSSDPDVAQRYVSDGGNAHIFHIHTPAGFPAYKMPYEGDNGVYSGEQEYTLPRGTSFKFLNHWKDGDIDHHDVEPILGTPTVKAPQAKPFTFNPRPTTAFFVRKSALSYDEVGQKTPMYKYDWDDENDPDPDGFGYAVNHLAHDRADDPEGESSYADDLQFHEESVHPKHIDYSPTGDGPGDSRVNNAMRGYRNNPETMPPLLLVHRHGVYQVADGHHRAEAAANLNMPVKAYVAYSPHEDEPFSDGTKGPFRPNVVPTPANPTAPKTAFFVREGISLERVPVKGTWNPAMTPGNFISEPVNGLKGLTYKEPGGTYGGYTAPDNAWQDLDTHQVTGMPSHAHAQAALEQHMYAPRRLTDEEISNRSSGYWGDGKSQRITAYNSWAAKGQEPSDQDGIDHQFFDNLDHTITHHSPEPEDITLYRGVGLDNLGPSATFRKLKPGVTFTSPGFSSSSERMDVAKGFISDKEKAAIFKIQTPAGFPAHKMPDYDNSDYETPHGTSLGMEQEHLFPKGTSFTVTKSETMPHPYGGAWAVKVHTLVPSHPSFKPPTTAKKAFFVRSAAGRVGMGDIPIEENAHNDFYGNGTYAPYLNTDPSTGKMSFTPERQALHDNIIQHFLTHDSAGNPVQRQRQAQPIATMLGGGSSSGKTTMVNSGRLSDIMGENPVTVDADNIKTHIPEYNQMVAAGDTKAARAADGESRYLTRRLNAAAFENGYHVAIDGTGAGSGRKMIDAINGARSNGYQVNGAFATVPTEVAQQRALSRGQETGRFVPPEYIEGSHRDVSSNFPRLAPYFDNVKVFDNTGPTTPIYSASNGQEQIHDPQKYSDFLAKGRANRYAFFVRNATLFPRMARYDDVDYSALQTSHLMNEQAYHKGIEDRYERENNGDYDYDDDDTHYQYNEGMNNDEYAGHLAATNGDNTDWISMSGSRAIRQAAWHMHGVDKVEPQSFPDPHANETQWQSQWGNVDADPHQVDHTLASQKAFALMQGIHHASPSEEPMARGVDNIHDMDAFLKNATPGSTFHMPLSSFAPHQERPKYQMENDETGEMEDYDPEDLGIEEADSEKPIADRFGKQLQFILAPGAKGVHGQDFSNDGDGKHEFVTGGKFQVSHVTYQHPTTQVHITQQETYHPQDVMKQNGLLNPPAAAATQQPMQQIAAAGQHFDASQFDSLFDGPAKEIREHRERKEQQRKPLAPPTPIHKPKTAWFVRKAAYPLDHAANWKQMPTQGGAMYQLPFDAKTFGKDPFAAYGPGKDSPFTSIFAPKGGGESAMVPHNTAEEAKAHLEGQMQNWADANIKPPYDPTTAVPRMLSDAEISNRSRNADGGDQTIINYNGSLHHPNAYSQPDHEFFDNFDHTIRNSPLPEPMTLHRGIEPPFGNTSFDNLQVGQELRPTRGFSSTSASVHTAAGFANGTGHIMHISAPAGFPAYQMKYDGRNSGYDGEQEYVLPRGTSYVVNSPSVQSPYDGSTHHYLTPKVNDWDRVNHVPVPSSPAKTAFFVRKSWDQSPEEKQREEAWKAANPGQPTVKSFDRTQYTPRVLTDPEVFSGDKYQLIHRYNRNLLFPGFAKHDPEFFENFDHTIHQSPLPTDMTLHRGMNLSADNPYAATISASQPGTVLPQEGFQSTSSDPNVAAAFAKSGSGMLASGGDAHIFHIHAPAGFPAYKMLYQGPDGAQWKDQKEYVLPRNVNYNVTSHTQEADGTHHYDVTPSMITDKPIVSPNYRTYNRHAFFVRKAAITPFFVRNANRRTAHVNQGAGYHGVDPFYVEQMQEPMADGTPMTGAEHLRQGADGSWEFTPERHALHNAIVNKHLGIDDNGNPTRQKQPKPIYSVLGGGSASGKSTMLGSGYLNNLTGENPVVVDPDATRADLPEYQQMVNEGNTDASTLTHWEASYLARRVQTAGFENNFHVLADGIGDGNIDDMKGKLSTARSHGYENRGFYATVPTNMALDRAVTRGDETGRYVPPTWIKESHVGVSQAFPQLQDHFDQLHLFNTTAEPPSKIYSKVGDQVQIHDPAGYQTFLNKANEQ